MLRTRVIPVLLLREESLIKTTQFGKYTYIGDPCNTVRIFNELEVDELIFLDTMATLENRGPNMSILENIVDECFMPLTYGGGITSFNQVKDLFTLGFEKVAINSSLAVNPDLIKELVDHFGSQSIIASIDIKPDFLNKNSVFVRSGTKNLKISPVHWSRSLESLGVGEILLTSIEKEGTWSGFDLEVIKEVSQSVNIPVIANGGAKTLNDISLARKHGASAIALGSMVLFQKKGMGVLVNFPEKKDLEAILK